MDIVYVDQAVVDAEEIKVFSPYIQLDFRWISASVKEETIELDEDHQELVEVLRLIDSKPSRGLSRAQKEVLRRYRLPTNAFKLRMGFEKFVKQMERECCTEWHKMGPDGTPYPNEINGQPISSCEDTWNLYFLKNAEYLYSFRKTYSYRLMFLAIHLLCPVREECAVNVIKLCRWIGSLARKE